MKNGIFLETIKGKTDVDVDQLFPWCSLKQHSAWWEGEALMTQENHFKKKLQKKKQMKRLTIQFGYSLCY